MDQPRETEAVRAGPASGQRTIAAWRPASVRPATASWAPEFSLPAPPDGRGGDDAIGDGSTDVDSAAVLSENMRPRSAPVALVELGEEPSVEGRTPSYVPHFARAKSCECYVTRRCPGTRRTLAAGCRARTPSRSRTPSVPTPRAAKSPVRRIECPRTTRTRSSRRRTGDPWRSEPASRRGCRA